MADFDFLSIASQISRMKTFPYLDGAHYVVMCMLFRERDTGNTFSRRHVVGSWFLSILMCCSGSVISNFLAGEPTITPFKYQENLVIATAIWYLINFFPNDLVHRFFEIEFFKLLLYCFWNVYLVIKIQSGVVYGIKHFSDAYIIAVVLGMAKGCGDRFMNAIIKHANGTYMETDNVILYVPDQVKCSFICSTIFVLSHHYQLSVQKQPLVFMACLVLFIHSTLSRMAFKRASIFSPLDQFACWMFFSWNGPCLPTPEGDVAPIDDADNDHSGKED